MLKGSLTQTNKISELSISSTDRFSKLKKRSIRHSIRVRKFRKILTVSVFIIILAMFIWLSLTFWIDSKISKISDIRILDCTKDEVIEASFLEQDNNGNPFKICAEKVLRLENKIFQFMSLESTIVYKDNSIWCLSADTAVLNQLTDVLQCSGNVTLNNSDGSFLSSSNLVLYKNDMIVTSNSHTQACSYNMTINADKGFRADRENNSINFYGNTLIVINN